MLGQSIRQNTVGLSIFAVITAGLIALTQLETKDRIGENIKAAKYKALHEVIAPEMHDNDLLTDLVAIDDPALVSDEGVQDAYVARMNGKAIAVILPAIAADGYTGKIRSIVGILADGTIAGVRVLNHQETPGLGDKIEIKKSNWIRQFEGKSYSDPDQSAWAVKKDGGEFDQLTGATITPRAVVKSVLQAVQYFEANSEYLLADPIKSGDVETANH